MADMITGSAEKLARWAYELSPTAFDIELATRSLRDTVAVALAARDDPLRAVFGRLPEPGQWAATAHVLSFDDLHLPSTAHVSAVCVPAVLAVGGEARAYLAAAGVMARLGTAFGWPHYASGWHTTCTAGAPAAAAGAAVALGLGPSEIAEAMALAVPAAGGVRRAFGTSAKALQVGFAADAGVRAARLVAAGANADPGAVDQWIALLGGEPARIDPSGPAIPGGLAVKLFPCCYSLQRPIAATRTLMAEAGLDPAEVTRIQITTPRSTTGPLIKHRPRTGAEGALSLEYAVAATLLDAEPGFASFTTAAVTRPTAAHLMDRTSVELTEEGEGLLAGQVEVCVETVRSSHTATLITLSGAPGGRPADEELHTKWDTCGAAVADLDWDTAPAALRAALPAGRR